jgi:hypothetical protein
MKEGAKGAKSLYYILFTHLGILERKKWLHELLRGKAMWFLISCDYINTPCGLFGGSHSFTLSFWSFIHYSSFILVLGWDMRMNC